MLFLDQLMPGNDDFVWNMLATRVDVGRSAASRPERFRVVTAHTQRDGAQTLHGTKHVAKIQLKKKKVLKDGLK